MIDILMCHPANARPGARVDVVRGDDRIPALLEAIEGATACVRSARHGRLRVALTKLVPLGPRWHIVEGGRS